MIVPERLLQRVQFVASSEPLDSAHPRALGLHREHQAGPYRLVVDQHGAGAALALAAAVFCAGQLEILTQDIEQGAGRVGGNRPRFSVYGEIDFGVHKSTVWNSCYNGLVSRGVN